MTSIKAVATVAVVSLLFAACGGSDDEESGFPQPDSSGLADAVMSDPSSVFGGDQAGADCFGAELSGSIGEDRLNELGFTEDSMPGVLASDELGIEWSATEVDSIIDSVARCVDLAAYTRRAVRTVVDEVYADCVAGKVGDDYGLELLVRPRFDPQAGGFGDRSSLGAQDVGPWESALESCGVPQDEDDGSQEPPQDTDGFEPSEPPSLPEAAAPFGLGGVVLPDNAEGITAIFDDLPAVLLGGERSDPGSSEGFVAAFYGFTQPVGCSSVGFMAQRNSPGSGSADHFVAALTAGADWDVDDFGRDGDLFWVTWRTTCSIADKPPEDTVFTATWATAGSPWFYSATAGEEAGLEQLLTAFVDAAT